MTCDICKSKVQNVNKHQQTKYCQSVRYEQKLSKGDRVRIPERFKDTIEFLTKTHHPIQCVHVRVNNANREHYWCDRKYGHIINFLAKLYLDDKAVKRIMERFVEDRNYQAKVLARFASLIALGFGDSPSQHHRFPAYSLASKIFDCEMREDVDMRSHYIIWFPDGGFSCCHSQVNGHPVAWWNSNEFETKFRLGVITLELCQQRVLLARKYGSLKKTLILFGG